MYIYLGGGGGHGPGSAFGVNTKVLASACYKLIRFIAHNVDSLYRYNDNQHLLTSLVASNSAAIVTKNILHLSLFAFNKCVCLDCALSFPVQTCDH